MCTSSLACQSPFACLTSLKANYAGVSSFWPSNGDNQTLALLHKPSPEGNKLLDAADRWYVPRLKFRSHPPTPRRPKIPAPAPTSSSSFLQTRSRSNFTSQSPCHAVAVAAGEDEAAAAVVAPTCPGTQARNPTRAPRTSSRSVTSLLGSLATSR